MYKCLGFHGDEVAETLFYFSLAKENTKPLPLVNQSFRNCCQEFIKKVNSFNESIKSFNEIGKLMLNFCQLFL